MFAYVDSNAIYRIASSVTCASCRILWFTCCHSECLALRTSRQDSEEENETKWSRRFTSPRHWSRRCHIRARRCTLLITAEAALEVDDTSSSEQQSADIVVSFVATKRALFRDQSHRHKFQQKIASRRN